MPATTTRTAVRRATRSVPLALGLVAILAGSALATAASGFRIPRMESMKDIVSRMNR